MTLKASLKKLILFLLNPVYRLILKFKGIPFSNKLVILYLSTSFLFILIHEKHLSFLFLLALSLSAILFSGLLILLSMQSIRLLFQKDSVLLELSIIAIVLLGLSFTGFFTHKSGILFIFFLLSILFLLRILNQTLYFKAGITGIIIMANAILTFSFLQFAEIVTLHLLKQNQYGRIEASFKTWTFDSNSRILSNDALKVQLKIPEEMFYFQPDDLKLDYQEGAGQLLLAISSSPKNPSRYPSLKIFLLPGYSDPTKIQKEFVAYLDILQHRNDIEELKELADYTFPAKNWKGKFWIFFNNIEPRYAKTGYYTIPLSNSGTLLIQISENLMRDNYHSDIILQLLSSFTISENVQ